jgi:hypothetical protein
MPLLAFWIVACGGGGSEAGVTGSGGGSGGGGTAGGGAGGGGTTTGGFTLALAPATVTIAQNATTTATVALTRTGSFTGAVTLVATGLPNGVTASFAPAQIAAGQTTSTLTLTAASTATVGAATITVGGAAVGATSQLASAPLTVTAATQAGPFTLTLSATSYLALPPTIVSLSPPLVTIARNPGFTGPVNFTTTGAPPTLFVTVTPSPNTGNTGQVFVLDAGTPAGTYPVVIHGAATGLGERTVTLNVVVGPPSTGTIRWTFCDGNVRSIQSFFAVKDGSGPWTRLVPTGNAYAFSLAGPTAQVALVTNDSGGFRTTVYQASAQEIAALAAAECTIFPGTSTRTASGSFTNVPAGDLAIGGMGGWLASSAGNGGFTMLNLPSGPLDLLAVRSTTSITTGVALSVPNRAIVRRGVTTSGATMPPLDFASTESFALVPATWTFGNTNGQAFSVSEELLTASGTVGQFTTFPQQDVAATTRTVHGLPAAQTLAGDLHQIVATIGTVAKPRATRQIVTYARTVADRALSFGPVMPPPALTTVAGGQSGRLRAQGTLPAEYAAGVALDVTQTTTNRFATVYATRAFLGATGTYDIQIPDLTAAVGWDTRFALTSGVLADYWLSGGGPVLDAFDARFVFNATHGRWAAPIPGMVAPADAGTYLFGRAVGSVTP